MSRGAGRFTSNGVLGEDFCCERSVTGANCPQYEKSAAELSERNRDNAVELQPAGNLRLWPADHAVDVLLQMVEVAKTQPVEDWLDGWQPANPRMRDVEADLKVDQVGLPIFAND